jgi:hypothetical protein
VAHRQNPPGENKMKIIEKRLARIQTGCNSLPSCTTQRHTNQSNQMTTIDQTSRSPIALHGKTINGVNVSDLFRRFTSEVVCKGWVHGESREAIFCKCEAASSALGIRAMGCMVMEDVDTCGAFEFSKECETVEGAFEFMQYIQRVLL